MNNNEDNKENATNEIYKSSRHHTVCTLKGINPCDPEQFMDCTYEACNDEELADLKK